MGLQFRSILGVRSAVLSGGRSYHLLKSSDCRPGMGEFEDCYYCMCAFRNSTATESTVEY